MCWAVNVMIYLINQNKWQENNFYQHSTSRSKKDQKERLILFIKRQMMMLLALHELCSGKMFSLLRKKIAICTPKSRDQKQSFCRRDKQKGKTLDVKLYQKKIQIKNFHKKLYSFVKTIGSPYLSKSEFKRQKCGLRSRWTRWPYPL